MAVRFYIMTSRKVTGQILNIDNEKRFALKNLINVSIFFEENFYEATTIRLLILDYKITIL